MRTVGDEFIEEARSFYPEYSRLYAVYRRIVEDGQVPAAEPRAGVEENKDNAMRDAV